MMKISGSEAFARAKFRQLLGKPACGKQFLLNFSAFPPFI
jgi:hypothetical protein